MLCVLAAAAAAALAGSGRVCDMAGVAWHGQPVPGGGTLTPAAFLNPATIDATGRIAFVSQVAGAARNQGIFVADAAGLHPVIMGCGGLGGSGTPGACGDPSPVGGTFSGVFLGTPFGPAINDAGDVLFIADVFAGRAPRGLFLYDAASDQVVVVAAVGDAAPGGGTFDGVGPGSLNNLGQVAFLGRRAGSTAVNVYLWEDGVVTAHVSVGDAVPGGGTFSIIGSETLGFADGTTIPTGPAPGLNDEGQVAFRGIILGGSAERGLFVTTGGVHEWYVARGEPTPAGGTYLSFEAPILNVNGEIAFFSDVQVGPGQFTAAWFAGSPERGWRKAIEFFDVIEGGEVLGMAISRNPLRSLDDGGDLVLWCDRELPGGLMHDTAVLSTAGGAIEVLLEEGDPAPVGGTAGLRHPWPAVHGSAGLAVVGAATPGAPGGILNAHLVLERCAPGDLDRDGDVDVADLLALLAAWGACGDCAGCPADLDGDCAAGITDLLALLAGWG